MFAALILICAAALPQAQCTAETAIDVIRGPAVASEIECAHSAQAALASTAIAPRAGGEYSKLVCARRRP